MCSMMLKFYQIIFSDSFTDGVHIFAHPFVHFQNLIKFRRLLYEGFHYSIKKENSLSPSGKYFSFENDLAIR